MRPRAGRAALITTVAVLTALAGCAGRRIDDGVYRSEHGYRIAVPGAGWRVIGDSQADLELQRADGAAGMLATATCRPEMTRRRWAVPRLPPDPSGNGGRPLAIPHVTSMIKADARIPRNQAAHRHDSVY